MECEYLSNSHIAAWLADQMNQAELLPRHTSILTPWGPGSPNLNTGGLIVEFADPEADEIFDHWLATFPEEPPKDFTVRVRPVIVRLPDWLVLTELRLTTDDPGTDRKSTNQWSSSWVDATSYVANTHPDVYAALFTETYTLSFVGPAKKIDRTAYRRVH